MQILIPDISVLEKIVRPVIVYGFLLIAFRVAGKRELGQWTPFDLIVLLTISNVLQNAMIGPDNSLGGGIIGAMTLFFLNGIISRLAYRFPRFEAWLDGDPTVLVDNGRVVEPNMAREVITPEDLRRALRKHELDWEDLSAIKSAVLELDGSVTIHLRRDAV